MVALKSVLENMYLMKIRPRVLDIWWIPTCGVCGFMVVEGCENGEYEHSTVKMKSTAL